MGGHCIPVDPYYLAWRTREFDFVERFIELAGDINLAMPRHVVELAVEALNRRGKPLMETRVGVMGVAFKPDVQDSRNAPAASVMTILRQQGAVVRYHDPHVPRFRDSEGVEYASVPLDELLEDSKLDRGGDCAPCSRLGRYLLAGRPCRRYGQQLPRQSQTSRSSPAVGGRVGISGRSRRLGSRRTF